MGVNGKPEQMERLAAIVRPIITYALVAAVLLGFLWLGKT